MAFFTHVLHIDFIDSTGSQNAKIMKQAEAVLTVNGSTANYSIDISFNGVIVATLNEGVDWINSTGLGDTSRNLRAISNAVNRLGLTNQVAISSEFLKDTLIRAKMIGRGGTGFLLASRHPGAAEIDLAGLLAGETVTFDSGGTIYGPVVFTEGIEFTDAATLATAINSDVDLGPLVTATAVGTVVRVLYDGGSVSDAVLLANVGLLADTVTGNSWRYLYAGGFTNQLRFVQGGVLFDGAISSNLRDPTYEGHGTPAKLFQDWLNDNVPGRFILVSNVSVRMVPIPEGTQVVVAWEEV